jgi:hypothetical protein
MIITDPETQLVFRFVGIALSGMTVVATTVVLVGRHLF